MLGVCVQVWDGEMAKKRAHFQFPPGVELAQTLHSLLAMHHGGHSGALLFVKKAEQAIRKQQRGIWSMFFKCKGNYLTIHDDNKSWEMWNIIYKYGQSSALF